MKGKASIQLAKCRTINHMLLLTLAAGIGLITMEVYASNEPFAAVSSMESFRISDGAPVLVVLQELLKDQTDERTKQLYEVYFVQVDTNYASEVEMKFKGFVPRVEIGTNNILFTDNGVFDKASKKPAKLFWSKLEVQSGDSAEVEAGYSTGPEGSVSFEYDLKRDGASWVIVSRRTTVVS